MPDWLKTLASSLGAGTLAAGTGDPTAWQRIQAFDFDKQYKQFQMQQTLEKLKMEQEEHKLNLDKSKILQKILEQQFKSAETENEPLPEGIMAPETQPVPQSELVGQGQGALAPGATRPTGRIDIQQTLSNLLSKGTAKQGKEIAPLLEILRKAQAPQKADTSWTEPELLAGMGTPGQRESLIAGKREIESGKTSGEQVKEKIRQSIEGALFNANTNLPIPVGELEKVVDPRVIMSAESHGIIGKDFSGTNYKWASQQREAQPFFSMIGQTVTTEGKEKVITLNPRTNQLELKDVPGGGRVLNKTTQPLPEKQVDNFSAAVNSLKLLRDMETVVSQVALGVPGAGTVVTWLKSKGGNEAAQDWLSAKNILARDAQSLIKGIPSNFDVQLFIKTIPSENDTPQEAKKKIGRMRDQIINAMKAGVGNYEKSAYEIPQYLKDQADIHIQEWQENQDKLENKTIPTTNPNIKSIRVIEK